jgi:hypothetical protein
MAQKIIRVNTNDIKSIKNAERLKARYENAGYTLVSETATISTATFIYETNKGKE